jgi:hypothetical protein
MVSSTTLTIIIIAVVVLIIAIAAIIIYIRSKPSSSGGSSGITGASGSCAAQCSTVSLGCSANNQLTIGFTGSNCPNSCLTSTQTTSVSGCLPPQCNSIYCNSQQVLYTGVNNSNTIINFCSTGATGTGVVSNSCVDRTTSGVFLNSLSVQSSSVANNQIFPIFLTTINKSIYQPTQPSVPSGVTPASIAVNTSDPTVSNDPYILYWNPTSTNEISFQRLSNVKTNLNITNSMFIYSTDGSGTLLPFSFLGTGFNMGSEGIVNTQSNFGFDFTYNGFAPPCAFNYFNSTGSNPASTLIYNPSNGLFQISQNDESGNTIIANLVPATDTTTSPPTTNLFTTSNYNPSVSFPAGCQFDDMSRFYSISAINEFL